MPAPASLWIIVRCLCFRAVQRAIKEIKQILFVSPSYFHLNLNDLVAGP